jgi:hypothetical protein
MVVIAFPGYCETLRFSSRFNNKAQRSRNLRASDLWAAFASAQFVHWRSALVGLSRYSTRKPLL